MNSDVLILIPARMASTRLPGKPLADIGGAADDRARDAPRRGGRGRAGRGRDRFARDRRSRDGGRRPRRDDAQRPRVRLGPHFRGARAWPIRTAAPAIVVNVQGDFPTLAAAPTSRRRSARSPTRRSTSRRWRWRSPRTPSAPIRTSSRRSARRWRRAACARSISPARPRRPATGRSTITSASTRIAARRSRASWRCRPRRWNSANGSSSCARSKPACASTWRSPRT